MLILLIIILLFLFGGGYYGYGRLGLRRRRRRWAWHRVVDSPYSLPVGSFSLRQWFNWRFRWFER